MRLPIASFVALMAGSFCGLAAAAALDSEIVYVGCVEASGSNLPVATALRPSGGGISGFYLVIEPDGSRLHGTLEQEADLGEGAVRLRWADRQGSGLLTIRFSRNQSSFTGYWRAREDDAPANWWGKESVISALGSHKCEKKDSA